MLPGDCLLFSVRGHWASPAARHFGCLL